MTVMRNLLTEPIHLTVSEPIVPIAGQDVEFAPGGQAHVRMRLPSIVVQWSNSPCSSHLRNQPYTARPCGPPGGSAAMGRRCAGARRSRARPPHTASPAHCAVGLLAPAVAPPARRRAA